MEEMRNYPTKYIDILSYEHFYHMEITALLIGPVGTPY